MMRAYDELEREMNGLRNNIGRRIEASDTEAINAWRSRERDARERRSEEIEGRATQLAAATERTRERTSAGARVIEIAPIREAEVEDPGAQGDYMEPAALSSSIVKKPNKAAKHVKIEEVKTETECGSKTTKSEKKVKTERMDASGDGGKAKRKDRKSSSSKSTTKTRDTSSAEESSADKERRVKQVGHRKKPKEWSKKDKNESDTDEEEQKGEHRGKGEGLKGRNKLKKRRRLDFDKDDSSAEEKH